MERDNVEWILTDDAGSFRTHYDYDNSETQSLCQEWIERKREVLFGDVDDIVLSYTPTTVSMGGIRKFNLYG